MITAENLPELAARIHAAEADGEGAAEWMRGSGIEREAVEELLDAAVRVFHAKVAEDGDVEGAVVDLVGQSFRLEYEARGLL